MDATSGSAVSSFDSPAVLSIHYDPSVASGPPTIAAITANGTTAVASEVDATAQVVRALISTPGTYGLFGGQPLTQPRTISGSVSTPSGGSAASAVVLATAPDGRVVRALTNVAGAYTLTLDAGRWTVTVDPQANYAAASPVSIDLTASASASLLFQLANPVAATAAQGVPVGAPEVGAWRTANSRTFQVGPGEFATVIYPTAVNEVAPDGSWRPIDTTLVASSDPNYPLQAAATPFTVRFAATSDPGAPLSSVGLPGGGGFTIGLAGGGSTTAIAAAEGTSGLVYRSALPGVDLHYGVSSSEVKESIELSSASAPSSYTFTLTPQAGTSLAAAQLGDGSWSFVDTSHPGSAFVLNAPTVADASAIATLGAADPLPVGTQGQGPASMQVLPLAGGSFQVTVSVDHAWLLDPARMFPVLIDPTVTIQPNSQDAVFNSTCSTCTGSVGTTINVGGTGYNNESAIAFALGQIPSSNITNATLSLYWTSCAPASCGSAGTIGLYQMTAPWSSATTTGQLAWNSTALAQTSVLSGSNAGQWLTWSVPTTTIQNWLSGAQANDGFLLAPVGSTGELNFVGSGWGSTTQAPELAISWTGDASVLYQPSTVHSNGAELSWSAFPAATGAHFQRYEIHRSLTPNFTVSSANLVATIGDVSVTRYLDTTAAPNASFSYEIVTVTDSGSSPSNPSDQVSVQTPADGQAIAIFQPLPSAVATTYLNSGAATTNYASGGILLAGGGSTTERTLVNYDLRTLPSTAVITAATLGLYSTLTTGSPGTVEVHAVTDPWTATSATWNQRQSGINWTSAGGDYNPAAAATFTGSGGSAHWETATVTSLVQGWVNGTGTNDGVLIKLASESTAASDQWLSANWPYGQALTPALTITYQDGSHALPPSVSFGGPGPNATISGTSVALTAAASDDGGIANVQFSVDGATLATITTGPWKTTLDSTTLSRGTHTLTATAVDTAGNSSTSSITVTVANSAAPTVSAPTVSGSGTGTVTISATASDDIAVTKVSFFVDGVLLGTKTSSPYSISWNTLTSYDGTHQVTAQAFDGDGHSTLSTATPYAVTNTSGTEYQVGFALTSVPREVSYDPTQQTQTSWPIDVTLTNNASTTLTAANTVLRYLWTSADDTAVVTTSANILLSSDIAAGGQQAVTVNVTPPTLANDIERARYTLSFDLYDETTSTYFSAHGNKPLTETVTTNLATPLELGLERFQQYDGADLGGGASDAVNLANGNNIISWTPFDEPGIGLDTVLNITYNSLEDGSISPVGNNVSLAISSLTPFGAPLDVHPNGSDALAGRTGPWIGFVDGDGSYHVFTGQTAGDGTVYWAAPAGVDLYLRQYSTTDTTHWWALTKPDRTTYLYDQSGYPTAVTDANGNTITLTESTVAAGDDAYGATEQVTAATDAGGRKFTLSYYTAATTGTVALRGKVKTISDHNSEALTFSYYNDGNLLSITEGGGTNSDGSWQPSRKLIFNYTNTTGSGPAITTLAGRKAPSTATVQSTKLYSLIDYNGNETSFAYNYTSGSTQNTLASRTDRSGATTAYTYNTQTATTTVAMPLSRTWTYGFDSLGRVTSITDPLNEVTSVAWNTDNTISRVTEPDGVHVDYTYNQNGYLTSQSDELGNTETLTYQNIAVDSNDVSGKWQTGRAIPHISQLVSETSPNGNIAGAQPGSYTTSFTYDAKGNPLTVTDALGNITTTTYNSNGTIATETLPNNGDSIIRTTTYNTYDANGLATKTTNAAGGVTLDHYDAAGNLLYEQDPNHASYTGGTTATYQTQYVYDRFGRLIRSSQPKSTQFENGLLIWTDTSYDPNDNVTSLTNPHYGIGDSTSTVPVTTTQYDTLDRAVLVTSPNTTGGLAQSKTVYDAAGRVIETIDPLGVANPSLNKAYATFTSYDPLDRVASQTQYQVDANNNPTVTETSYSCYDLAGDLRSVTGPNGAASFTGCPAVVAPASYTYTTAPDTTEYAYDAAHRQTQTIDPLGRASSQSYDANSNITTTTDANGSTTTYSYDQRDEQTKVVQPFNPPVYKQTILTDSPLTYWRLDESVGATTATNLGSDGTSKNGSYASATLGTPGAIVGDSDTAMSTGTATTSLYASTTGFSMELWANLTSAGSYNALYINGDGSGSTGGYGLYADNANPCGSTCADGHAACPTAGSGSTAIDLFVSGDDLCVISAVVTLNTWHQLVLTHSGASNTGTWSLYVDGALASSITSNGNQPSGTIEHTPTTGSLQVNAGLGTVDEVAFYGAALTTTQVQNHYTAAKSATEPTTTSETQYDALGNVNADISPRAYDASADKQTFSQYVTSYGYDALNRLVKTTLPATTYSDQALADAPATYWRLGESAGTTTAINLGTDGAAKNGTYSGATLAQPGALVADPNTAMSAGSVSTSLYATDPANSTIEGWVYLTSAGSYQTLLSNGNGQGYGGMGGWGLWSSPNNPCGGTCADGHAACPTPATGSVAIDLFVSGDDDCVISTTITLNAWHYLAVSHSGGNSNGTWSLYLDDTLAAAITSNGTQASGNYGNYLPQYGTLEASAALGTIDEFAYYTTALTCGTTTIGQTCTPTSQIGLHYQDARNPQPTYEHQAYDANGNLLWSSQPTTQSNPANVAATDKTVNQYWDTGAIYSTQAPATPTIRYDYTAEGWQASDVPETAAGSGTIDYTRLELWNYFPDGNVQQQVDATGNRAVFTYDLNGNQLTATAALGAGSPSSTAPVTVTSSYDQFNQLNKVQQPAYQSTNIWTTKLSYDLHGNVTGLVQNELDPGTYQSTALADAPATYWRFGETSGTTANNLGSDGAAKNGTYSGATLGQPGALVGDPNTAMSVGSASTSLYTTDPGNDTIEGWAYLTSAGNGYQPLFTNGNGQGYGGMGGWGLWTSPNDPCAGTCADGHAACPTPAAGSVAVDVFVSGDDDCVISTTVSLNSWHYLAVTHSGGNSNGTWSLYVDDALAASITSNGTQASGNYGNYLPQYGTLEASAALGTVDEFGYYTTALTCGTTTIGQTCTIGSQLDNHYKAAKQTPVQTGRTQAYTYDNADQLLSQVDDFATPTNANDDETVTYTYSPTGLEASQTLSKANGSGGWATEQQLTNTYYANGLPKTEVTTNGGSTTFDSHTLFYLDVNGLYNDGNITKDVFQLHGPDSTAACYSTTCTASWVYDSHDRLTAESSSTGTTTQFALDVYGNVLQQTDNGTVTRTATYGTGSQLTQDSVNGFTTKYFYDPEGNLQCTTTTAWTGTTCPANTAPINAALLTYNAYDNINRLTATWKYSSGALTDSSTYVFDALDRGLSETETHSGAVARHDFTYAGLSTAVTQEQLFNGAGTLTETKQYIYDADGASLTLTDTLVGGSTSRYSFIHDTQGSVELLIDQSGNAKEAYGYTAYGNSNLSLARTASGFSSNTNPIQFQGDRFDTGSNTVDMGARRYSASLGRFYQRDAFRDALSNLGLSADPLNDNRYNLEGANPINFVEVDGHRAVPGRFGMTGGQAFPRTPLGNPGCGGGRPCNVSPNINTGCNPFCVPSKEGFTPACIGGIGACGVTIIDEPIQPKLPSGGGNYPIKIPRITILTSRGGASGGNRGGGAAEDKSGGAKRGGGDDSAAKRVAKKIGSLLGILVALVGGPAQTAKGPTAQGLGTIDKAVKVVTDKMSKEAQEQAQRNRAQRRHEL